MWHVEDVRDVILIVFVYNAIYVEDRSNTPKGCNAMYVKDVKDRSNTPKGCNANHTIPSNTVYIEDCYNLRCLWHK